MVISRVLRKYNYSLYSPFYTSIRLVLPDEFLSLINAFFKKKKTLSADCFDNNMLSHLNIKVIKFPFEFFFTFSRLAVQKASTRQQKGGAEFYS